MYPLQTRQGIRETPLHMYNPLPSCITIKRSPIHGLGLYAIDTISEDTNLGLVLFSDQSAKLHRTPLGGFGNHSENPNCKKIWNAQDDIAGWYLLTLRDIEPDEEITWTYPLYKPFVPISP